MQERYGHHPSEVKAMTTEGLREAFAIPRLFDGPDFNFVYSHYDRMIIGGVSPAEGPVTLPIYNQLKADYFLQRREMGIINIGGAGAVTADGIRYDMDKRDCLYLGKGIQNILFESKESSNPAKFYLLSAPAHQAYPATLMKSADATPAALGAVETSNQRTIYKYLHEGGIKSCQLVMGLTVLNEGSVWNTMPPHTHNRRMEVYLYFDVKGNQSIFHFMGEPQQTRHLVLGNEDVVISPPWSIHAGCGTASYSFIWGMAGENQSFADMDGIEINNLR